ncbi:MAG: hypothetical protein P4M15_01115 [Alphaproteobacteria bacterium]|nr:hypothetical protein [Alphaproteobacteria bacterium]
MSHKKFTPAFLPCLLMGALALPAAAKAATPPISAQEAEAAYQDMLAHDRDVGAGAALPQETYGTMAPSSAPAADARDNRGELNISTIYDDDPSSSNVNGGTNYGMETVLYSPILHDHWRLFAGELFSHELEPYGEGHINYSRSSAGAEYTGDTYKASLSPTFNDYNGNERVGAAGNVLWGLSDSWEIGGGAQLFSRDTPLRALNAGITANAYDLNANWYREGARNVHIDGNMMAFSDNNVRSLLSVSDTEYMYRSSLFNFDGLGNLAESQNSKDENRPYFNPRQDVMAAVGGRVGQDLYRRYDVAYDHSLEVKSGMYWQKDYGGSPMLSATYAQHVNYKNNVDASLGVTYTRQDSDGYTENDIAFLLNLATKM